MKWQLSISTESILSFEPPRPLRVENQILLCCSLGSLGLSQLHFAFGTLTMSLLLNALKKNTTLTEPGSESDK